MSRKKVYEIYQWDAETISADVSEVSGYATSKFSFHARLEGESTDAIEQDTGGDYLAVTDGVLTITLARVLTGSMLPGKYRYWIRQHDNSGASVAVLEEGYIIIKDASPDSV